MPFLDAYRLHDLFRLYTGQVDVKQSVLHHSIPYFDTVRQNKTTLKLPRGNAAMKEVAPFAVVILTAADHQLAVLKRDRQVFLAETGHGQSDPVGIFRGLFDVEWRIAVVAGLSRTFKQPFKLFEAQHIGMRP